MRSPPEYGAAPFAGSSSGGRSNPAFWRPIQPSSQSTERIDVSVFSALQLTIGGAILLLGFTLAVKRSGTTAHLSPGALASSFAVPLLAAVALSLVLGLILAAASWKQSRSRSPGTP